MSIVKVNLTLYNNMIRELNVVLDILTDSIYDLDDSISDLQTIQSGHAIDAQMEKLAHSKTKIDNFNNEQVVNMIEVVQSLINAIENNLKPENANSTVELDIGALKQNLRNTIELFSSGSSELKSIVSDSAQYKDIIRQRHSELDDGFGEILLNPIDEMRQKKAEEVFRHNELVLKNINVFLIEELSFKNEIDAFENLLSNLDKLEDKFTPIKEKISNISLYDSFMDEAFDVQGASSTVNQLSSVGFEVDNNHGIIHTTLDIIGLVPIPIFSQIADLSNALIYAVEGDWKNAGLSVLNAVPIVGSGSAALKYLDKLDDLPFDLINKVILNSNSYDIVLDLTFKPFLNLVLADDYSDYAFSGLGLGSSIMELGAVQIDAIDKMDLWKILKAL